MKTNNLFGFIFIFLLASCTSSGRLTRRYKSVEYVPSAEAQIDKLVSVTPFLNDKEKEASPKPRIILDALSTQGQKAFVNALSDKEKTTEKFLAATTSSFPGKENISELIDFTQPEKRINLSVENLSHNFGNRVVKVKTTLKFTSSDIQFKGCDRLITQYQTVELGKLNYNNSSGFEGSVSGGLGYSATVGNNRGTSGDNENNMELKEENSTITNNQGSAWTNGASNSINSSANISASAKYSGSKTFAEEVMLRQRIVAITASITDKNTALNLYQESISGIDLTGTTIADVVLLTKNIAVKRAYSFSNLMDKDGKVVAPDDIKTKESRVKYPNINADITADFSHEIEYRAISKGARTISESDDKIILYHGKATTRTITLFTVDQIKPKMWIVVSDSTKTLPVRISGSFGSGELIFTSYLDALNFISWIREQTLAGDKSLFISKMYRLEMPSDFTNLAALTIKLN